MITAVVLTFIIGYLVIVFEHPLRLDKTVPALLMGALCWAFVTLGHLDVMNSHHEVGSLEDVLLHHIGKVAEILIFLIGAMTIVELVDLHKGFAVITNAVKTNSKFKMLILVSVLAFFLSAILDNLTTTIVIVSLLRKLVPERDQRIWFVSFAVIAANAGGAWSPIGDVTTTMLWVGNKVSTQYLIAYLVLPAIICMGLPLLIATQLKAFKGKITLADVNTEEAKLEEKVLGSRRMLAFGLGGLIFVPIFKTITHLPPYMGMMLALGVVWLVSEFIHPHEEFEKNQKYSAHNALSRIEMSSILFFLGILVAVAALESVAVMGSSGHEVGLLSSLAEKLDTAVPNQNIVVILLGFLSAIIDNVPLVAASMGMYTFEVDHFMWHFIAYSAGTGGSMLIIGSAAGVAAMGMEKIDFIWYLKNISWIAAIGFIGGALTFIGQHLLF